MVSALPSGPWSPADVRNFTAHRARLALVISALVLLAASTRVGSAHAQIDTVEISNVRLGVPVIASVAIDDLAPLYGIQHIGYTRGRALVHAYQDFGPWTLETVADSALVYDLSVAGDGLARMAFGDPAGRLIYGQRSPSGWTLDTLGIWPGATVRPSLAPGGAPSIAFTTQAGGSAVPLRYARRSGGSWIFTDVDADVATSTRPALALAPGDLPSIFISRGAPTASGFELAHYTSTGLDGPFSSVVVDSEAVGPVVHEWHLAARRPFVAYRAIREGFDPEYRFGWRDVSGQWHSQVLGSNYNTLQFAVSLALDPFGAPGALWIEFENFLVATAPGGDEVNCGGGIENARLRFSTQRARAPGSPFQQTTLGYAFDLKQDAFSSVRAVSSHAFGLYDVCWREPRQNCAPYGVFYTEVSNGVTSVPMPHPGEGLALAVTPNPVVRGGAVQVRFRLAGEADATIELRDLAGRAVRTRAAGRRMAGDQEFAMPLGDLAPGLYWLSVSVDGWRQGSRTIVVR